MRTLILYATKSGASLECAQLLASRIENCTLCNVTAPEQRIEDFDLIIIGTGVRMGRFYKPMRTYLKQNRESLLAKRTAFFLCNAYPDKLKRTIEKNIPQALIDHAVSIESFGGKAPFSKPQNQSWMLMDHVSQFVQAISDK